MKRLLPVLTLLTAMAVACGGSSSASKPTETAPVQTPLVNQGAPGNKPPALTVFSGEASVTAALGTYCWQEQGAGVCADMAGPITPRTPLAVDGATELVAVLESESMEEASARVSGVGLPGGMTSEESAGDTLLWAGTGSEGTSVPATFEGSQAELDVSSLEPGSYVLTIFIQFERGGDASYGVLLDLN